MYYSIILGSAFIFYVNRISYTGNLVLFEINYILKLNCGDQTFAVSTQNYHLLFKSKHGFH